MRLLTIPAVLVSLVMIASAAFAGPTPSTSPIIAGDAMVIAVKTKAGANKKAAKKTSTAKAGKKKARKKVAYKTCGTMMYRDKKSRKCVSAADKNS